MYKRRLKTNGVKESVSKPSTSFSSLSSSRESPPRSQNVSKRSVSPIDLFDEDPTVDEEEDLPPSKKSKATSQRKKSPRKEKQDIDQVMGMLSTPPMSDKFKAPRPKPSHPQSYMQEVLTNAGMTLSNEETDSNLLSVDQSTFVRELTKSLNHDKRRREPNQCADNFLDDFEKYFTDKKKFRAALSPTKNDPESNVVREDIDSLVRILLSIDLLQQRLLEHLLDKIAEYTVEDSNLEDDNGVMWTRMILQQLRYLNKIVNSEAITQRLFDVIHSTPSIIVQHEIINCLPDIINDEQRKPVADELIELMKSEKALTGAVLLALENLCLEESELEALQHTVVRSLRQAPSHHAPAFVKFILSHSKIVTDELLNGLRSELSLFQENGTGNTQVGTQTKPADLASARLLVYERLRDSVLMSRKLADTWLKNIGKVNASKNHRPIDIIMLLTLHSTSADQLRKKIVESHIKTKIKNGLFSEALITETFTVLMEIIKQNFKDMLRIASVLLQSPDVTVSQFGAFLYMECFVRLDTHWRKRIVLELLDLVRMSTSSSVALSLLHTLTTQHTTKISPFITLIMLLLDCVTELSVAETRQLMDILCMVAFGDPDDSSVNTSSFQDEIYMLVQKQLACPDSNVFRSGVVCTVMAIKHMVSVPAGEPNVTPEDTDDDDNIPLTPRAKEALNLLELVLMGTRTNPEAQVLTYDQLSFIIMNSDSLDKSFIKKVSAIMQGTLQHHFVIASSDFKMKDDGLEANLQYCLDEDIEDPIALDLAGAVARADAQLSCSALPGLVRVVRALEAADLTEIDALLGCAVALPGHAVLQRFTTLEPYLQRLALDTLFHACNWLREIVNCFAVFVKAGNPEKVLKRLRLLIYLQGLVSTYLPYTVTYSPPPCYFTSIQSKTTVEKVKRGGARKGKKKKEKEAEEGGEENDSEAEEEVELAAAPYSAFRSHLRELDLNTAVMFTLPLDTAAPSFKEGINSAAFGQRELCFLLDDFVSKLRHKLSVRRPLHKLQPGVGFDNLDATPAQEIIMKFSKLSGHLTSHLQQLVQYFHKLIKLHDGIWDAPGMFGPGTSEAKQSLSLILSAFNIFFSWTSIKNEAYSKPLTYVLMKLGDVSKSEATSLNVVLQKCVSYLKDISSCIMDLGSAVGLVTLINNLLSFREHGEEPIDLDIGEICEDYLKRRWYDTKGTEVKGTEANKHLGTLLAVLLDGSSAIPRAESVVSWFSREIAASEDEPTLTTFPLFNKSNFGVLISGLCKGLVGGVKQGLEGKGYSDQLTAWDTCFSILQQLTITMKAIDSKVNLRQFLKGCLPILKLFLAQGVNVCSCMFKMESQLVPLILKKLQVVTRYIQTVCNYSKVSKDGAMIKHLPVMRGCLESILLTVKNMVLQNKCTDAFFMGAMRNKGLKGEIIATQDEDEVDTPDNEAGPSVEPSASQDYTNDMSESVNEAGNDSDSSSSSS